MQQSTMNAARFDVSDVAPSHQNEHLAEIVRAHLEREGIALARDGSELDGLDETEALLELANLLLDAREVAAYRAATGHLAQRVQTTELTPELLHSLRHAARQTPARGSGISSCGARPPARSAQRLDVVLQTGYPGDLVGEAGG